MTTFEELSIADIGARLRSGELRVRDLAERALARMALGAYHHVDPERTRRQAEAADGAFQSGYDLGPLQGLPVSVKDLYGVPGFPVFAGSPRRLPERFERPGPVVRAAVEQLAVVVGKTHTVEFAFGGVGTNPHHPTPVNPWDAEHHRAPGGSSAGAGVSLSEGSAFLAFGTDTAGSVRIPASWTGNVGLKTTKGRWSTEGIVPLSTTLDTAGILTRTVEDLVTAFAAIDDRAKGPLGEARVGGLRIGRCDRPLFEDCSPGVVEAIDAALAELERAGGRVVELDVPEMVPTRELFDQGGPVSIELHHFLTSELPEWYESLDPNVRARVGDAGSLPATEYLRRLGAMQRMAVAVDDRLRAVDVLVSPTVANTPPRLADIDRPETYRPENLLCLRNTCIPSYLGLCALTLPVGRDAAGMPVGMQLVAPAFEERRLLAVALAFERVLGTGRARLGAPPRVAGP